MDEQILKMLTSIRDLLKGSSSASGSASSGLFSRTSPNQTDKGEKTFKALNDNIDAANKNYIALNTNLIELTTVVGKTSVGFGSLNVSMAKFMASLTPVQSKQLNTASALAPATAAPGGTTTPNKQAAAIVAPVKQAAAGLTPAVNTLKDSTVSTSNILNTMLEKYGKTATALVGAEQAVEGLWKVATVLTGQFMTLAAMGLGSVDNLKQLSTYAFESGMSLKEYTALVRENSAAVSRAGTLENFQKTISANDAVLAQMGVFGAEATHLQATLAEANTVMGISQDKLTNSIHDQIGEFDKLREKTSMTAAEFGDLVKRLGENSQVQRELLGTSGNERIARQKELIQIATVGQRMGLTAAASQQLTDALIQQRGDTVKSRFENSGSVRQLGQVLGLGDIGERVAQIQMKGQNATGAETEEMQQLLAQLEKSSDEAYKTGSLGVQSTIDHFRETLGQSSLGKIMDASRSGALAQDSGTVNQKAFGQHVDKFGQSVGMLSKYLQGFEGSVGPAILSGVSGLLATVFRGPILSGLGKVIGKFIPGVGAAAEAGGGVAVAAGETAEVAKAATSFGSVLKSGSSIVIDGLKGLAKAFGPISAIVDGIIEAITGDLANALDPNGGVFGRIEGIALAAFSAIPQMIIDGLTFVFGPDAMKPIQHIFDMFKTGVSFAINSLLLGLTGIIGFFTDFLPKDSGLRKLVDSAGIALAKSVDANADAMQKLGEGDNKTLKEIGAANTKAADDADKKSKAATTKVVQASEKYNDVQYGTALSRSGMITDAQAVIGQPQVQTPPSVNPSTVNTDTATAAAAAATTAVQAAGNTGTGSTDMMTVLNAILAAIQGSLTQEQRTADNTEQLVKLNRPTAQFTPADVTADRLLKPSQAHGH